MMNEKITPDELDYYNYNRKPVLSFVPLSCRKLLDIGCGGAAFGELVKREIGAEVWGVEPESRAAEQAKDKIDRIVESFFDSDIELPEAYFDVITFNDSLEHFPDPFPPLETAKRFLAPGGVIVASIPNVRYIENVGHFLLEKDWEYQDMGILDRTHLRFFTRKSMIRTFEQAGYLVENIEGINPHYWGGKKLFFLKLFFSKWISDMKYLQYVVVARPKPCIDKASN